MTAAWWILAITTAYAGIGVVFAAAFVTVGVVQVDHAARGSRWAFRLLILPGVALLWPLMLARWTAARRKAVRT